MTALIIALIIALICAALFLSTVIKQGEQIRILKEDVEKHKQIAEATQHIFDGFRTRVEQEQQSYTLFHVDYCTSDSDLMKYPKQKEMDAAARNRLVMLLGHDILRKFSPDILPLGEGKSKYSLLLKIKKL